METISLKIALVLNQIKEQIDITPHKQLGWFIDKEEKDKKIFIMTSDFHKKLGLTLMVGEVLHFCSINYYELENILGKIKELKFIKSFRLINDGIGSSYFKIMPEKNFIKLYNKFSVDKLLNEDGYNSVAEENNNIFPEAVIKKLPLDVQNICSEFNFNYSNKKPIASMLLLRRLLPLSIVRKFQAMERESEIKTNGDYFETKALLGKIEFYLKEKRVYTEIMGYKLLTDSSQHSYIFVPQPEDVKGAALAIRVFLEDLF